MRIEVIFQDNDIAGPLLTRGLVQSVTVEHKDDGVSVLIERKSPISGKQVVEMFHLDIGEAMKVEER